MHQDAAGKKAIEYKPTLIESEGSEPFKAACLAAAKLSTSSAVINPA